MLQSDPAARPSAQQLLQHPLLMSAHQRKILKLKRKLGEVHQQLLEKQQQCVYNEQELARMKQARLLDEINNNNSNSSNHSGSHPQLGSNNSSNNNSNSSNNVVMTAQQFAALLSDRERITHLEDRLLQALNGFNHFVNKQSQS